MVRWFKDNCARLVVLLIWVGVEFWLDVLVVSIEVVSVEIEWVDLVGMVTVCGADDLVLWWASFEEVFVIVLVCRLMCLLEEWG